MPCIDNILGIFGEWGSGGVIMFIALDRVVPDIRPFFMSDTRPVKLLEHMMRTSNNQTFFHAFFNMYKNIYLLFTGIFGQPDIRYCPAGYTVLASRIYGIRPNQYPVQP